MHGTLAKYSLNLVKKSSIWIYYTWSATVTAAVAGTATTATVALLQLKAGQYIITTSSRKNSHKSREHK